jgi:hypothetical protein
METIVQTFAQALENKTLPKYNMKLSKKTMVLLQAIASSLPKTALVRRLVKVTGSQLIEDGGKQIGDEIIDPNKFYTVYENVKTKVNHLKRMKRAFKMSNSPFNVILYGFKFIGDEYKNEWIEIINETFRTSYPPAFIEDEKEDNESA